MLLRWPFGKKDNDRVKSDECWPLSLPLVQWSKHERPWTLADALEGTVVFGATGSAKTSVTGRTLATAFLRAGFGGLVLTVKKDERALWEAYCRETGRSADLLSFGPNDSLRFDFLSNEGHGSDGGFKLTENIVHLFTAVLEIAQRREGGRNGQEDSGFWRDALMKLQRDGVGLLLLANGRVSIPQLYKLIISAPQSQEEKNSHEWQAESYCWQCLKKADQLSKSVQDCRDLEIIADYFLKEFPKLAAKTRSIIVSSFTSAIDIVNRGLLRELLCTTTNVTPKMAVDGKILLMDLPISEFREVGAVAQVIMKYMFQMQMDRRNLKENPRPVFLFADEAHHFCVGTDALFQTTCRSVRVATVMLSQNVNTFYDAFGGNDKAQSQAKSLWGNLNTKIFHCNSCRDTNVFAAELIGRSKQFYLSTNQQYQPQDEGLASWFGLNEQNGGSAGFSEQLQYEVEPSVFSQLRTGGVKYNGLVDAIVFQNGTRFKSTGRPWLQTTFKQQF